MRTVTAQPLISSGDRKQARGLRVLGSGRQTTSFRNLLWENLQADKSDAPESHEPVQIPAPKVNQGGHSLLGMVKKVFSLIHSQGSESRKLRLIETVSLGEKRFVALIQAEGKSFLIGGCSAGVSLLSRLDDPSKNMLIPECDESLSEVLE